MTMNDSTYAHDPLDMDVLIGRLVDGEARNDDRRRFDDHAAEDPALWQRLALRQLDNARMTDQVEQATDYVERIPLPAPARRGALRFSWAAVSGWAAVLIVGLSWALVTLSSRPVPRDTTGTEMVDVDGMPALDHEAHFERYLDAPYVIGELQPLVLDVTEMTDGRFAVNIMRRIEEVLFVDPEQSLPIDDDGALLEHAQELRRATPAGVN